MSDNTKKVVEDVKVKEMISDMQEEKSERDLMQEFIEKYQALCEEYKLQIVVTPAYKISQDTGVWSTVLQTSIGKMPAQDKE